MVEFALYLLLALSGYFTVYQLSPGTIESLIIQQSKSVPMIIARIALVLFLFIAIPININPGRAQVVNLLKGKNSPYDNKIHILVTVIFLFGPCMIGIVFPKIDSVFSFLGGACSTLFGITFPCKTTTKKLLFLIFLILYFIFWAYNSISFLLIYYFLVSIYVKMSSEKWSSFKNLTVITLTVLLTIIGYIAAILSMLIAFGAVVV